VEINAPLPSLFTFHVRDKQLQSLMGLSISHVRLNIPGTGFESEGPLLFTHWGLSGPAVLKLSAFAAKELHKCTYRFSLKIDFLPDMKEGRVEEELRNFRTLHSRKQVINAIPFDEIPKRCWNYLLESAGIPTEKNWADIGNKPLLELLKVMKKLELAVNGKSTFKEEFVTCGGVSLHEIDTRTFQSNRFPGLYFAGEVLDVDAVTGGFNFQHAWTSGWLAAEGMATQ
jgi:predicted Rossmann fold flavoprotein